MFDAAAQLRDDYGCSTLFIDHTGHAGERTRGTSAKGDDADYVLIASYEGEHRGPDVQRTLEVRKLKDEETTGRWPIRLAETETSVLADPIFPVVEIGEIDRPVSADGKLSLVPRHEEDWWKDAPEVSVDVLERLHALATGNRGVECAAWICRLLAYVDDMSGMTKADIKTGLSSLPRPQPYAKETFNVAVALLKKAAVVTEHNSKLTLILP